MVAGAADVRVVIITARRRLVEPFLVNVPAQHVTLAVNDLDFLLIRAVLRLKYFTGVVPLQPASARLVGVPVPPPFEEPLPTCALPKRVDATQPRPVRLRRAVHEDSVSYVEVLALHAELCVEKLATRPLADRLALPAVFERACLRLPYGRFALSAVRTNRLRLVKVHAAIEVSTEVLFASSSRRC